MANCRGDECNTFVVFGRLRDSRYALRKALDAAHTQADMDVAVEAFLRRLGFAEEADILTASHGRREWP